jgi:hypothetical protein
LANGTFGFVFLHLFDAQQRRFARHGLPTVPPLTKRSGGHDQCSKTSDAGGKHADAADWRDQDQD